TPSRFARPGCAAGGTAPPDGAFAVPRTSTPLLAGSVQPAAVLSGAGDVSSPLRMTVPPYPAVQGSGLKKVSAMPKLAPPLVMTVDPAAMAAGSADDSSSSAWPLV